MSTVSPESKNDTARGALTIAVVSPPSDAAAISHTQRNERDRAVPRAIKLVSFLDVTPFPVLVQRLLGWHTPPSRKRSLRLFLTLTVAMAPQYVAFAFMPASFVAGNLCFILSNVMGLLTTAAIADQPWPLFDNETADINNQRQKARRAVFEPFVLLLFGAGPWSWAVHDIGGLIPFYTFIAATPFNLVFCFMMAAQLQTGVMYAESLESTMEQLTNQMRAGALTFSEAVDWAIAISQRIMTHNDKVNAALQPALAFTAATSVLYFYTFVAVNSHPGLVILALMNVAADVEQFLRAARFNNKVEKLRFHVNLMRSLNDKVVNCVVVISVEFQLPCTFLLKPLCYRPHKALACPLAGRVEITATSWRWFQTVKCSCACSARPSRMVCSRASSTSTAHCWLRFSKTLPHDTKRNAESKRKG